MRHWAGQGTRMGARGEREKEEGVVAEIESTSSYSGTGVSLAGACPNSCGEEGREKKTTLIRRKEER